MTTVEMLLLAIVVLLIVIFVLPPVLSFLFTLVLWVLVTIFSIVGSVFTWLKKGTDIVFSSETSDPYQKQVDKKHD